MDKFLDKYVFPYTNRFIGRAKKTKDGLPVYSAREELSNMISHIPGMLLGVAVLVYSIINAHSDLGLAGGIIYGLSLIVLYTASSVYHGLPSFEVADKKLFRLFDHCSIFILVAGTCTPCILGLIYYNRSAVEWVLYTLIWGMAIGGITLLCVNMKRFKSVSVVMYVVMGGLLIGRISAISQVIGETGTYLIVGGGLTYLLGLLFYGLGTRREWMHFVFHLLCLAASTLHCVAICGYVI